MTTATRDITQRTLSFAVRVVRLVNALPRTVAGAALGRQLIRAGTSIGANVEEAQGASSRKEFIRRMNISRSEARETLYWLRLIEAAELIPARRLKSLMDEANELVSILTAIVKKSRAAKE